MAKQDSLIQLPMERWIDLQEEFKRGGLKGIAGYHVLDTQRNWIQKGIDYGFKVFSPFGDLSSGMVAINLKKNTYELIVQCPHDDISKLEEALQTTDRVDWEAASKYAMFVVPFATKPVVTMLERIAKEKGKKTINPYTLNFFCLPKNKPLYEVYLPPDITFGPLSPNHIDLVISKWPHNYSGADWYYEGILRAGTGYGLYKDNQLVSFLSINECGFLLNLFTLEEHRRNGYSELITKLVTNLRLKEKKDTFCYVIHENVMSTRLFQKIGFDVIDDNISWLMFKKERNYSSL